MEAQIAQLSPPDAAGFQRFLNENRVKLLQMESCLESPFLGWRDIFNARLTHVTISCLDLLSPRGMVGCVREILIFGPGRTL